MLAGVVAVAVTRLFALPRSPWEYDEFLFAQSIVKFDPVNHHPHPPGYPLVVALGKLFNYVLADPFTSLVYLAWVSTVVGSVRWHLRSET